MIQQLLTVNTQKKLFNTSHKLKIVAKYSNSSTCTGPGFAPRDAVLDLEDEANKQPVPTEREDGDRLPLQLTLWWLAFVALVFVLKSRC